MRERLAVIPALVRRAMVDHARRERPRECCGFLVGTRRRVLFAVAMPNVAVDSGKAFRIDDRQHITLRRWLRRFSPGLDIVGIYHSHPDGPALPSASDHAQAHYPGWLYAIVGVNAKRADVRVYRVSGRRVKPMGRNRIRGV